MSKTVANLRDSVSGILQGLNLNNVVSLNTALERSVRELLVELDIPEATARNNFILYDGVTDYTLPSNMLASGIVDLRPQSMARTPSNQVTKQYPDLFDREKGWVSQGYKTTVEYNNGTGILRVASNVPSPRIELDTMTATTGWTADGVVATGLTTDQSIYWQPPASLIFQLASGTGTLTKSISSQDLTDYISAGVGFLAIYAPSITNLTSITLRLGSDASNYYSVTATTGFTKAFASGEQQLVAFDFSTKTTTGTPTLTAIDYAQVRITTGGTIANFHTGDLFLSLPSPHTLIYNTPAVFLASGSTTPSASITATSDVINLNDAAYALYELKAALAIAKQQGGGLASGVVQSLESDLYGNGREKIGLIPMYRADNPSQELRPAGSYYSGIYG